jgi:hypothetical protein
LADIALETVIENAEGTDVAAANVTLAVDNIVSKVVATMQQELSLLDRTVASGGTPLSELTKLGTILHPLSPQFTRTGLHNRATSQSTEYLEGQPRLDMLLQTGGAPANLTFGLNDSHFLTVPAFTMLSEIGKKVMLETSAITEDPVQSQYSATNPAIERQQLLPSAPRPSVLDLRAVTRTPALPSMPLMPLMPSRSPMYPVYPMPSMPLLPPPYLTSSPHPGIPLDPFSTSLPTPEVDVSTPNIVPDKLFTSDWTGPEHKIASASSAIGTLAPLAITTDSLSRAAAPSSVHSTAPTDSNASIIASSMRTAIGHDVQFDAPHGALKSFDDQETASEPRQGTIYVDGVRLGRWIVDRLAKQASRPTAGTTGIDPRLTATYPGAPAGV